VTPGSTDPLDHHTAAILPIAEASAFPWTEPAKRILVYICQKLPYFWLSKLSNRAQKLLSITMPYTFCCPVLTIYEKSHPYPLEVKSQKVYVQCTTKIWYKNNQRKDAELFLENDRSNTSCHYSSYA
jgi:hypothetical protein